MDQQYNVNHCYILQCIVEKSRVIFTMGDDGLVFAAKVFALLHGMDSAMDDIPLFSPAAQQRFLAYSDAAKQCVDVDPLSPASTA